MSWAIQIVFLYTFSASASGNTRRRDLLPPFVYELAAAVGFCLFRFAYFSPLRQKGSDVFIGLRLAKVAWFGLSGSSLVVPELVCPA